MTHCPAGQHPNQFFICVKNNVPKTPKPPKTVIKVVHITSNNHQNSMVTRNTKITDQQTVGQAIDGCKDLTKKSPDNALKKSCNIMMAATFNYCMTHTKLWLTDSNICSDNLYLKKCAALYSRKCKSETLSCHDIQRKAIVAVEIVAKMAMVMKGKKKLAL